jgi:hypothetical protein
MCYSIDRFPNLKKYRFFHIVLIMSNKNLSQKAKARKETESKFENPT